jgi:hypothetical protein
LGLPFSPDLSSATAFAHTSQNGDAGVPAIAPALIVEPSSRRRRQKNANQQKQARCEYQQECIIDNRHEVILFENPQRVKMELCNR